MGGILILKSSNHWGNSFFALYGGKSIWGDSDNGNQRGGIVQVKTIIILEHFAQGKVTLMVTFKEKAGFIFTSLVLNGHI